MIARCCAYDATDAFGNVLSSGLRGELGNGSQQTPVLYGAEEQAQDFVRENARFSSAAAQASNEIAQAFGVGRPGAGALTAGQQAFLENSVAALGDAGQPARLQTFNAVNGNSAPDSDPGNFQPSTINALRNSLAQLKALVGPGLPSGGLNAAKDSPVDVDLSNIGGTGFSAGQVGALSALGYSLETRVNGSVNVSVPGGGTFNVTFDADGRPVYHADSSETALSGAPAATLQIPEGFQFLPVPSSSTNGFQGAAFFNPDTNKLVVSIAGTKNVHDLLVTDPSLVLHTIPDQLPDAADFLTAAIQTAQTRSRSFNLLTDTTLVGHSLGGALGALLSVFTGLPAITENAPGIAGVVRTINSQLGTTFSTDPNTHVDQIFNFRSTFDPVSLVPGALGSVINVPAFPSFSGLLKLVPLALVNPAAVVGDFLLQEHSIDVLSAAQQRITGIVPQVPISNIIVPVSR